MSNRRKQAKVHSLIEEHYWEAFWYALGGAGRSGGPSRSLEYLGGAPSWYNEVADIAHEAGWIAGKDMVETIIMRANKKDRWFGLGNKPEIPARVYADCYAAARLTR